MASLGELLPQTSMEVRKKRLYLGVSSHEDLIFIEICKYNCAIIFAAHTHIYIYINVYLNMYTLIHIYIHIYVGMLCSKDLASHTLCNLHSIDIFVNRWIHLCIPFLLVVSPVYIGIYGDACA